MARSYGDDQEKSGGCLVLQTSRLRVERSQLIERTVEGLHPSGLLRREFLQPWQSGPDALLHLEQRGGFPISPPLHFDRRSHGDQPAAILWRHDLKAVRG